MTYLHIHQQGLPKHAIGERRIDGATAENVHDALRAHGFGAAAQAMEYQQVDLAIALRVLAHPARRRARMHVVGATSHPHVADRHSAGFPEFAAVPA